MGIGLVRGRSAAWFGTFIENAIITKPWFLLSHVRVFYDMSPK